MAESDWDLFAALAPIILLVVLTLKPNPLPPSTSLSAAALFAWTLRLVYFESDPNVINAGVVVSALGMLGIVAIIFGAVVLFKAMELTGCLTWLVQMMKSVTQSNPVAEAMLIGHAFVYIVEGASGFGTPVALASPILIELGHAPIDAISATLVIDALCTNFGAVGTPISFGLGSLGLDEGTLRRTGLLTAVIQGIAAQVVVPCTISMLAGRDATWASVRFIWSCTLSMSCVSVLVALWNYEFSTVVAGLAGFPITLLLIKLKVGLQSADVQHSSTEMVVSSSFSRAVRAEQQVHQTGINAQEGHQSPRSGMSDATRADARVRCGSLCDTEVAESGRRSGSFAATLALSSDVPQSTGVDDLKLDASTVAARTFPITGSVVLLLLTRIDTLGVKHMLKMTNPTLLQEQLGTLGQARVSFAGVITLEKVFNTCQSWKFELLFTPFIIPFLVVALATMFLHRTSAERINGQPLCTRLLCKPFEAGLERVSGPAVALTSAMILIRMLTVNSREAISGAESDAPADLLGRKLAEWLGTSYFLAVTPIGALGAFLGGSTTVSNLTFGAIHKNVGHDTDMSVPALLALQTASAASGNMICLSNIIAAKSVVGSPLAEGVFIRVTAPYCALHLMIATAVAAMFLYA
eukprot:TRINITY_DN29888_c0_g1_i1.p1 TRINITY_DN29888_c0_g1~~TRINITY_DN29888_c0_g1_i1.p1  ORF type:complete len:638 (-),score=82.85 TRINITY_DN29888_c0_g1_i1:68-1981(-)